MKLNKFYFNTGVRPENRPGKLYADHVWRNGTMQIPFECEAKENSNERKISETTFQMPRLW